MTLRSDGELVVRAMESTDVTDAKDFKFPDFIESHGKPPNHIIPLCRSFLKENENIMIINGSKLKQLASDIADGKIYRCQTVMKEGEKHVDELFASCAKSSPYQITNNKTRIGDIARIIAYNAVNFSFYSEVGEMPWWIEMEKGGKMITVGKDDEFFALTSSFERAEKQFINEWSTLMKPNVSKDTGRQWCNYEYLYSYVGKKRK